MQILKLSFLILLFPQPHAKSIISPVFPVLKIYLESDHFCPLPLTALSSQQLSALPWVCLRLLLPLHSLFQVKEPE